MRRRTYGHVGITLTQFESPKDWGAAGDGTTDDTDAFNTAISKLPAAGGLIVLDEGDYNVPSPAGLTTGGRTLYWLLAGTVNGSWTPALPGTILNSGGSIGAGEVGTTELADSAVTTVKLADNAVTLAKLEHGTSGDILYYGASGEPFRLAKGADGQVLKLTSGLPAWGAEAGGIADGDKGDITVSASGTAWTVDAGAITYAKMQDVSATARVLGRKTALAGDVEECTLSEILDFIGSAAQGDVLYRGASGWARLGAGTAGQFLQTQGAAADPQWATPSSGTVTRGTAVATTSGTSHDFTSLPAGLDRITVMLSGVKTNNIGRFLIQIGDADGIETTGYSAGTGDGTTDVESTAGFVCGLRGLTVNVVSGIMTLTRINGNTWVAGGTYTDSGSGQSGTANSVSAGSKTLSGELTQLRLTTESGTANFNAGTFNILYE